MRRRRRSRRIRFQIVEVGEGFSRPIGKSYQYQGHAQRYLKAHQGNAPGLPLRIEEVPAPGWKWTDCNGEAHSNANIDHCGVCLPRWGRILVPDEDYLQRLGEIDAALRELPETETKRRKELKAELKAMRGL